MRAKPESLKTALRKYEGSPEDNRRDAAGAKKLGISPAAYQRTAQDKREDLVNARKLQAKDNGKRERHPRSHAEFEKLGRD